MNRIKKTAQELEKIIRSGAQDLRDVQFRVHAEKSVGGWSATVTGSQPNLADINLRLKQFVDTLANLYQLNE